MESVQIIELKESILADNDKDADALRKETKQQHLCYLNVMSSPGSGKTSVILALLEAIGDRLHCGVMEADIDSDVDAKTIRQAGFPVVQLHTGGMCHLDAQMSRQGLHGLFTEAGQQTQPAHASSTENFSAAADHLDLVILENVGNLVCPAEFDTGADINIVILSVPEGDDKPLKYPLVFTKCDAVLINKIDSLPAFDFDMDKCREYIRMRNKNIRIFPVSAKTKEGISEAADWLVERVNARRS